MCPLPTAPGMSNNPSPEEPEKRFETLFKTRDEEHPAPVEDIEPDDSSDDAPWRTESEDFHGESTVTFSTPVPTKLPKMPSDKAPEKSAKTLASNVYQSVGSLDSKDLLYAKEDQYKHLEGPIMELTQWVQDTLTEEGKTEDVSAARAGRGEKYNDMIRVLDQMILQKLSSERGIRGPDRAFLIASVINEVLGLGPLEALWRDPKITEIIVDGPYRVLVEISGKLQQVPGAKFRDQEHLLGLCQQILGAIGRRVDVQHPLEDGRLPDKSRVNVVHPAIAPAGPLLTIRRHREEAWTVRELVGLGSFTPEIAEDLAFLINAGCSTLVLGGTGSGKTTILNALSGLMPAAARILTIEDNLELQLHPDRFVAAMEARPASASGTGMITIRDLVKNSLRMRPDRIVVGEVRDAAAFDMLQAMNTGHNGSMTTFHANGADEAIDRLESMVMQAGELDPRGVRSLIAGSVDLLVVVERYPEDGSRRVSGVFEIPSRVEVDESGHQALTPIPIWEFIHDETVFVDEDGHRDEEGNEITIQVPKVIGHYEKMNEVSGDLVKRHRLNKRPRMSIDFVYQMSDMAKKRREEEDKKEAAKLAAELSAKAADVIESQEETILG
jgi:pilus assembly protein CpaF